MSETKFAERLDNMKQQLGRALGRIASGVYILTVKRADGLDGMLASWVQQAAFEPPLIMISMKGDRDILAKLGVGTSFTLNVLSKKNLPVFKAFAKGYTPGVDRFANLAITLREFQAPILSDSISYLDCVVRSSTQASDHVVLIAEVTYGEPLNIEDEPMVHLRSSGFHY